MFRAGLVCGRRVPVRAFRQQNLAAASIVQWGSNTPSSFRLRFDAPHAIQQRSYVKGVKNAQSLEDLEPSQPKKTSVQIPNQKIKTILHAFRNVTLNQDPIKGQLAELAQRDMDAVTKWQLMVQLLVTTKNTVIAQHDIDDMEQFKRALHLAIRDSREGSEILEIHRNNWDDWIRAVFPDLEIDYSEKPTVPKTKMLRIIDKLLETITGEEFVKDISPFINDRSMSVPEKGRELLTRVSNLHKEIMSKYGFKGDAGYINCQRSLVIHFFGDEDINQISHSVSRSVFNFTSKMIQPGGGDELY